MKKIILLSILFPVLFISCKKDEIKYNIPCSNPTNDQKISRSLIKGQWHWVSSLYTTRGFPPFLKTPATENYTRQLKIVNNTVMEFHKNYTFEEGFSYDINQRKLFSNEVGDTAIVLIFIKTAPVSCAAFKVCNDSLFLHSGGGATEIDVAQKWVRY